MNKTIIGLILATVLAGAFLIYQTTSSKSLKVLTVPDIESAAKNKIDIPRIRIGGRVGKVPEIQYQVQPYFLLKFSLVDPSHISPGVIAVEYRGLKPAMFEADKDVIVEGNLQNGVLVANQLLTQCPSKYEPPKPG